ncbi:MAG: DNA ligase LigA-related protein, partial [Minisyncoccia bacterium]
MKKQDAQKRIQKLMQEIRHHSDLYHKHDRPEISDEAYDSLWQELVSLEQAFPDLKDALSPTVRIGDKVLDGFEKSIHLFPQWSFDNIFDWKGLQDWEKKIKRFIEKDSVLEHEILDYIVELKIDGLKVILDYENGRFVRGSTRGDGTVGENITENLKTIHDIALVVPEKRNFSVVGEAWIEKTALVDINTQRALSDLPPYANPRNLAAGTLRQLDTSVVARRNLKTFVYDFDSNDISFQTHHDEL